MVGDYLRGRKQHGRNVIMVTVPFPQITFTCVANERTNKAEGGKFKRRGTRAGVTDYLFWWDNAGHGLIEIKDETGGLQPSQRDFKYRIIKHGHKWGMARRVYEVRDLLMSWGLECHNMNCIEPAASFEVKKMLVHDMNRPI